MKTMKTIKTVVISTLVTVAFIMTLATSLRPTEPKLYTWGPEEAEYTILLKDSEQFTRDELSHEPEANLVVTVGRGKEIREYIDMYSDSCKVILMTPQESRLDKFARNLS